MATGELMQCNKYMSVWFRFAELTELFCCHQVIMVTVNLASSLLALVVLETIYPVSSHVYFKKGHPHVNLNENAIISGSLDYSRDGRPYSSFQGIPYATIPDRFEPSKIHDPAWEGVKSFVEPGPECIQLSSDGSSKGTDDSSCLTVNVYVPMNNSGGRDGYPVMVYIHGGGFVVSSGVANGPKYFMDEDVILLNFNYRLGVFGFLSLDKIVPGNNALKDMVNLLKWVQKYIEKFNGNPRKVTIFGESAGSVAVSYILQSPLTEGLFHRVIGQSGSSSMLVATDPDPRGNAVQLATYLKCPTSAQQPAEITSEEILTCLKNVPAGELAQASMLYRPCWPPFVRPFFFPPVPEPEGTPNAFLTEYPVAILADETRPVREIPYLMGAMEDEGGTMYAGVVAENPQLLEQLSTDWDNISPLAFDYGRYSLTPEQIQEISRKIRIFYFGSETAPITLENNRNNLTNLFSDQLITHSVHWAGLRIAARGNKKAPVYLYQYAYRGPVSVMGMVYGLTGEETKRSCHADDLQHLFNLSEDKYPGTSNVIKPDTPDEEFSKNLVKLWVSFAKHGEPKHFWGPVTQSALSEKMKWRPVTKKQADGEFPVRWWRLDTVSGYATEPFTKERMQFWDDLYRDYFTPIFQRSAMPKHTKTEL